MDLVSIVMPSYNSARFIEKAILSVLSQHYVNWELLIVDDCSKDDSVEIIKQWESQDKRIHLFALSKNVGAAIARNIALQNAKGRYIAFLDSDDVWESDKLKKQLEYIKANGYAFIYSSYYIMQENGEKTGKIIKVPACVDYHQYLRNTIIGCLTVLIDKELTGDFRMPLIKSSHDMALWLLIMKRGIKAHGMNEVLAGYRLVATSNTAKKWKAAKDVWRVYRDIEKLSFPYSLFCFCCYAWNAIIKRI